MKIWTAIIILSFCYILTNPSKIFADSQYNLTTIAMIRQPSSTPTSTSQAGGGSACQSSSFFGLEPWYYFLDTYKTTTNKCGVCFNVLSTNSTVNIAGPSSCPSSSSSIPLVILAIVDDLLRIAGIVSVGFIFFAAFQYITSQGNPELAAKAQRTIIYSITGLVIAVSAIGVVTYIGNNLIH